MSVSVADLLSPVGRLDPAVLWPGETTQQVQLRVQAYLTDATTRTAAFTDETTGDEARTAWVYYRAYDAVYQRMVSLPSAVAFTDEGSGSYVTTQMNLIKDERDAAFTEFDELVDLLDAVDEDTAFTTLRSLRDRN